MAETMVEQRVTNLEDMMAALIEETARLSREMREFKDEMREFKDEMRTFKDQMGEFKDEMREFKDEMRLNNERRDAELQSYRREWRQQYGELSNKMGTLAEDLVAPSLPRILKETVTCPAEEAISLAVRVRRAHPTHKGLTQEFDVIASCGNYALFNETKGRLRPEDIDRLLDKLGAVRDYFPEYQHLKAIGSVASLYIDPSLVHYATRQGVLALATGDELMEVLNESGLVLREF